MVVCLRLRLFLFVPLAVLVFSAGAQEVEKSEREAVYHRYLEFASYVKGGSITPHWMADGSSFWYARRCTSQYGHLEGRSQGQYQDASVRH